MHAVSDFVAVYPNAVDEIVWVLFNAGAKAAYDKAIDALERELS